MKKLAVSTESGNQYLLTEAMQDYDDRTIWHWSAKEGRSLDPAGKAEGVVLFMPEPGKSMTLVWVLDGRLKIRVTSRVTGVKLENS